MRSAIKTGSESYNEEEDSSVTSAGSSQHMSEISINKETPMTTPEIVMSDYKDITGSLASMRSSRKIRRSAPGDVAVAEAKFTMRRTYPRQ